MKSLSLVPMLVLVSPAIYAQAADDLDCDKCVDQSDINFGVVGTGRLRDGSVTLEKLSEDVQAMLEASSSQTDSGYVFAGFTSTGISPGAATTLALVTEHCESEFGTGARMATSLEIIANPIESDAGH